MARRWVVVKCEHCGATHRKRKAAPVGSSVAQELGVSRSAIYKRAKASGRTFEEQAEFDAIAIKARERSATKRERLAKFARQHNLTIAGVSTRLRSLGVDWKTSTDVQIHRALSRRKRVANEKLVKVESHEMNLSEWARFFGLRWQHTIPDVAARRGVSVEEEIAFRLRGGTRKRGERLRESDARKNNGRAQRAGKAAA